MNQAVREYRRRLATPGLKRLEVAALASDADLIRRMAKAPSKDDMTSERLRTAIQAVAPDTHHIKLKDWLAVLPDKGQLSIDGWNR